MRKNVVRLLAAIMLMLLPVLALAEGNSFAVVKGGKLNLREYASSSSRSLGKYSTGSWVRIVGGGSGGFTEVRTMDGKHGYMSDSYLDFGAGANSGTVRYANGGYVNLRSGPSLNYSVVVRVTSGSTVYIQDESYEWNYITVWQNGYTYTGYMHESFINKSTSTATVTTRNGGKVNVRSGPSSSYSSVGSLASGTKVSVLLKGNGWYQISANGIVGFMSTQYLSGTGNTVGSNTGSATTSTQVAYVNNPRSTQVLNLRESPSQTARSIGQYRNGTQVKVVSKGATWCEVYVGTRHGYMMTKYLSFNGSYVQPTYTATPVYIYVTPTPSPTPLVQLVTAVPPAGPAAGTAVSLVTAAGASNNLVNVYNDSSLTSLKAVYEHGKQATMLQYGASVCMVLVDGGVAYVSIGNVNY